MTDEKNKEVGTTGHSWDGLEEYNNPLPRWWLWTFYATILFSIVWMVLYPAIPLVNSYTEGTLGQSDRAEVEAAVAAMHADRLERGAGLDTSSMEEIRSNAELREYGLAAGEAAFGDNCATCHGRGAQGFPGYPNLNDDVWIWGGTLDEIRQTIRFGIRSDHPETHYTQMPAFLRDGVLTQGEVADTADYVLSLSGHEGDADAIARGGAIFAAQCASCHMADGTGDQAQGAPNLTDREWLYGGDRDTVIETISYSRFGIMPAWENRLDPVTIRALALYVHALGGGEEEEAADASE